MLDQSFADNLSQEELQHLFDLINPKTSGDNADSFGEAQIDLKEIKESFYKNIPFEEIDKYIKEQEISESVDSFLEKELQEKIPERRSVSELSDSEFARIHDESLKLITLVKENRNFDTHVSFINFVAVAADPVTEPTCQDRMISWTTKLLIEILVTCLTAIGIRFRNGINWGRIVNRLMQNPAIRQQLESMIVRGVAVTALFQFFKILYAQGLLGFVVSEVADFSFIGMLQLIASVAVDFIPGAGEAKLIIQLGICAGGAIYVYTQKPQC